MNEYKKSLTITATQLKLELGKYLDMTINKKDVVITKNNKKIARLTPYITEIEDYFIVKESALDYVYGGKKVSYTEYMQINEKSSKRMEFINGEIHLLASPTSFHQDALGNLHILFSKYFKNKKCKVFLAPFDVHFNKKDLEVPDVMQPDIVVACDYKTTINKKGRYMGIPSLVVEILSPSTRSKDMIDKLNTFMLSGVKEYWIIDIKNKCVYIYNFINYSIETMLKFNINETITSSNLKDFKCNVIDIFDK